MGKNNKKCPRCGHKMKQQFIGLQHSSCGMSWKGSAKQSICIETRQNDNIISKA